MTKPFPNDPFLQGNFAPIHLESTADDLIVEGEIPKDLNGVFYRNTPNPQYPPFPGEEHHWFLGEGMVHGFSFENGKAGYKSRYVQTDRYLRQKEAGRRLYSTSFTGKNADDAPEGGTTSFANTNILEHAGKLWALEEGSLPILLNPENMETLGETNFDGKYTGAVTAHPKIDPISGSMLWHGSNPMAPEGPEVTYGEVDASGELTKLEVMKTPYGAMIHDFICTDKNVILPVMPATFSLERILAGGPPIAWEPDKGSFIGIMPRDGKGEDTRWFEGDPAYVFHPMNAYEEDGKIIADVMQFERVPLFPDVNGVIPKSVKPANLTRWTFDLSDNTNSYKIEQVIEGLPGEFPRLDDRYAGLKYNHGFYGSTGSDTSDGLVKIVHHNHKTGKQSIYSFEGGGNISEPIFVPRNENADEGDGYVLTIGYRTDTNTTDVIVLDAGDISKGPVATVKLPVRVPYGFHGNWVSY